MYLMTTTECIVPLTKILIIPPICGLVVFQALEQTHTSSAVLLIAV